MLPMFIFLLKWGNIHHIHVNRIVQKESHLNEHIKFSLLLHGKQIITHKLHKKVKRMVVMYLQTWKKVIPSHSLNGDLTF